MRRTGLCALACLAVSLLVSNDAMAQGRRGGGFGGPVTSAQLLGATQVQDELKLTGEQKEKITALQMEGGGNRGGGRRGQNQSDEERAAAAKAAAERNEKFEAVLNADQKKRLKEILLQQRGGGALAEAEVATELKLSDNQKSSVKTIGDAVQAKIQGLPPFQQGDDFAARAKQMTDIRTAADAEYLAVLTDEQKAKLTAMKGTKFDLDPAALRGGGRGRGRRNNN